MAEESSTEHQQPSRYGSCGVLKGSTYTPYKRERLSQFRHLHLRGLKHGRLATYTCETIFVESLNLRDYCLKMAARRSEYALDVACTTKVCQAASVNRKYVKCIEMRRWAGYLLSDYKVAQEKDCAAKPCLSIAQPNAFNELPRGLATGA